MSRELDAKIAERFGTNVRLCREFLGMTAHQLSERSGLTPAAISQIENGKREPLLSSAIKISQGLGASLERLCQEAKKK